MSALLALLSVAPAGLLRPAPLPSPSDCGVAAPAAPTCCCDGAPAPASPVSAPASMSCGCCGGEPVREPALLPAPVAPLAAPMASEPVATPPARPSPRFESGPARCEAAPPARLLHCVHLI